MVQPVCIAIVGAESTGKTTLAKALVAQWHTPRSPALLVEEYLREWCERMGRTPTAAEQLHIATVQSRRVLQARSVAAYPSTGSGRTGGEDHPSTGSGRTGGEDHPSTGSGRTGGEDHPSTGSGRTGGMEHPSTGSGRTGVVLADSVPLMTAVYSELYFGDASLYPFALEHHRTYALTLLTGLDIAWVADGLQRDSEALRQRFDARLRSVLHHHNIPFATVYGQGQARPHAALQALDHYRRKAASTPAASTGGQWQWQCEKCSDAACEHRLFRGLL